MSAQQFLSLIKSFGIQTKEIPLSCWQLALYHTFIYNETNLWKFTGDLQIDKERILTEFIDEKCQDELQRRKLDDIIELVCEIQFLELTEETVESLNDCKWKEVDHLQFFLAMLQGHWGRNQYSNLLEYATHHLIETIRSYTNNPNEYNLHQYKLCCVSHCLFSPETFISFNENSQNLGFTFFRRRVNSEEYYAVGSNNSPVPFLTKLNALSTDEDGLLWKNAFGLCRNDNRFTKLLNNDPRPVPVHSFRKDECTECNKDCKFDYSRENLKRALKALKSSWTNPSPGNPDSLETIYDLKTFQNRENENTGYLKCFPFPLEIKYIEMRIVPVPEKLRNCHPVTLKVMNDQKKTERGSVRIQEKLLGEGITVQICLRLQKSQKGK